MKPPEMEATSDRNLKESGFVLSEALDLGVMFAMLDSFSSILPDAYCAIVSNFILLAASPTLLVQSPTPLTTSVLRLELRLESLFVFR